MQAEKRRLTTLFTHGFRMKMVSQVLVVALVLAGCRGDQDAAVQQGKKAADENAIAKQLMADGRYTDAKLQFEYVLSDVDGTNVEARFGMVLSELLQFASLVRIISGVAGDDSAATDENDFLHQLIDDLLNDLIQRFDDLAFELKRLKADPVFRFVLDQSTPVYLTDTDIPTLDLQGEWDRGEVFLLDVGVQLVLGLLNYAQAMDLKADYLEIFNDFTDQDIDLDIDTTSVESVLESVEREFPKIQNLLAGVLNDNPRFLGLDANGGAEQLSKAGEHFGNAFDNLRKALFFASFDIHGDPDQSDDVVAYLGRGDGKNIPIDDEADLCEAREGDQDTIDEHTFSFQLRFLFIDDNEDGVEDDSAANDEELTTSPDTGCLATKLMDTMLPPGDSRIEDPNARVNLVNDVVPFLLSLVSEDIANAFDGGIVEDFIGDAIELDFGPLFHSGLAPRDMLVAWDTPSIEPDRDKRLIWMELECVFDPDDDPVVKERADNYAQLATKIAAQPYRVVDRLFCREEDSGDYQVHLDKCSTGVNTDSSKECDNSHFPSLNPDPATTALAGVAGVNAPSTSFGIASLTRDGVASQFPYLPLLSPSLNGVIYLDNYSLAKIVFEDDIPDVLKEIDSGLGFEEATQLTINTYIALLSVRLGPLLELAP